MCREDSAREEKFPGGWWAGRMMHREDRVPGGKCLGGEVSIRKDFH